MRRLWEIILLSLRWLGLSKCVHCDVVAETLTGRFPSLQLQHWLWHWPFDPAKDFLPICFDGIFPLMNFIPFHAGGILRSLSMYVRVREGIFISALKLAAYLDRKINKIQRNYPERPRHEKHLEEQMLFPHCQKWSDQNKMLLSPPLQHNQEKHTGVAQFCGGWFILGWVTSLYFLFSLRFFCNIKGQFILTRKQTHSPQHPRWLVYCLPQCFFLFELTYLHSHCTIKNKSMKRSLWFPEILDQLFNWSFIFGHVEILLSPTVPW